MKIVGWNETMVYCFVIIVVNTCILLVFHFVVDPNNDIQRHYKRKSKLLYCLFQLSHFIILIACVMSIRYIIFEGFTHLQRKHNLI